jgi:acyl-CoA synthetase (AMP-forming)/AMP-acid ligase II
MRWLVERLDEYARQEAMIWHGGSTTYAELRELIEAWSERLVDLEIAPGECVAICGDYSPKVAALLLALWLHDCIAVPISSSVEEERERLLALGEVTRVFTFEGCELRGVAARTHRGEQHSLLEVLRDKRRAGLILFSSGSTGRVKAILLDVVELTAPMTAAARRYRTLAFLLMDHIGGINTMLRTFAGGGTLITSAGRSPVDICTAVAAHSVEVLPTTPTFLTLLLMSGLHTRHDLSSLRIITYGTEAMPPSTLRAVKAAFPDARLKQTYGLTEVGILPTKSEDDGSLFMRVGGNGYETRVVDNILWIRTRSAMLGYLNAPAPFSDDGWFITGDAVEVQGEHIRVLGRKSELINVGGEKVYPAEVESVLLEVTGVADAVVFGKPSPVTGNIVCARVSLGADADPHTLRRSIKAHCRAKLQAFKVPMLISIEQGELHTPRYKKIRQASARLGS